jgi:hypothetical protein
MEPIQRMPLLPHPPQIQPKIKNPSASSISGDEFKRGGGLYIVLALPFPHAIMNLRTAYRRTTTDSSAHGDKTHFSLNVARNIAHPILGGNTPDSEKAI